MRGFDTALLAMLVRRIHLDEQVTNLSARVRFPAAPVDHSRASAPHRPREDGLARPADTSPQQQIQSCCLGSAFEVKAPPLTAVPPP